MSDARLDGAPGVPWLRIVGSALLLAMAVLAAGDWLDREADGYYEDAIKRALITFALARTLNGVISVIQGTEVAVEPGGVGVTLTPGEIVDPINDLIERFSWVMLVSTTSLGVQKILMDISAWGGIRILMVLSALAAVAMFWFGRGNRRMRRWAIRLVLLSAFLRFAMPLMVLFNHAVYDVFMAEEYQNATQAVERTSRQLERMSDEEQPAPGDDNWLGAVRRWFDEQASSLNVRQRMAVYQERLANATEHLLRLVAVFTMQTIILPLLFLWALARAVRNLGRFR